MEQAREFKIIVEIVFETNKGSYPEQREFDTPEAASKWLLEMYS